VIVIGAVVLSVAADAMDHQAVRRVPHANWLAVERILRNSRQRPSFDQLLAAHRPAAVDMRKRSAASPTSAQARRATSSCSAAKRSLGCQVNRCVRARGNQARVKGIFLMASYRAKPRSRVAGIASAMYQRLSTFELRIMECGYRSLSLPHQPM